MVVVGIAVVNATRKEEIRKIILVHQVVVVHRVAPRVAVVVHLRMTKRNH